MAEIKLLDLEGLRYFTEKLDAKLAKKVNVEAGKGLSSNDFTAAEKTKLAQIDLSLYALKTDVSAVYKYKGSVATYDKLPTTGNVVGDVYDVQSNGANYAWNGTAWDALGGNLDLTAYYTKTQTDNLLAGKASVSDVYKKTETYSATDIDSKLSVKASNVHSHAISEVTGLQDALNLKANAADFVAVTNSEIDGIVGE